MHLVDACFGRHRRGRGAPVAGEHRHVPHAVPRERRAEVAGLVAEPVGQAERAQRVTVHRHQHGGAAARFEFGHACLVACTECHAVLA